jgi:hypothetical protein
MSEKKGYENPVLIINHFDAEDVATVSGGGGIELPDHEWE